MSTTIEWYEFPGARPCAPGEDIIDWLGEFDPNGYRSQEFAPKHFSEAEFAEWLEACQQHDPACTNCAECAFDIKYAAAWRVNDSDHRIFRAALDPATGWPKVGRISADVTVAEASITGKWARHFAVESIGRQVIVTEAEDNDGKPIWWPVEETAGVLSMLDSGVPLTVAVRAA